jgi:hypothetical protein
MGILDDEFPELSGSERQPRAYKSEQAGGPPCPTCGLTSSRVHETRRHGSVIRRRRQCSTPSCARFTSYESTIDPSVVEFKLSKADKRILATVKTLLDRITKKLDPE